MPKRYFDLEGSYMTLQIDVTKKGMELTLDEIKASVRIDNLREVTRKEYNKLNKEYGCD